MSGKNITRSNLKFERLYSPISGVRFEMTFTDTDGTVYKPVRIEPHQIDAYTPDELRRLAVNGNK